MDFVLCYGIQNRTPIFLALKVSFRVVREDIKKTPSYSVGRPDRSGIENGILDWPPDWPPRLASSRGLIQHPISLIWKSTGHLGYSLEVKPEQWYNIALNASENSKKNNAALLRELSCWTILPGTTIINLIYVTFYITNK